MPRNFDGFHHQSDHCLVVTAQAVLDGDRHTYLRLAGEIDLASSPVLSGTVDWLTALAPMSVLIDLAELTFAGTTLCNFVVRVRHAVPDGAELILWRARPETERVLGATDMAAIATIRGEPADTRTVLV